MFQFPGFASATYGFSDGYRTNAVGFPIRRSWDRRLLAPPPSISQRATSFIASQRQGIHQMPFVTCSTTTAHPTAATDPRFPPWLTARGTSRAPMRNTHHRAHPCAPKTGIRRPTETSPAATLPCWSHVHQTRHHTMTNITEGDHPPASRRNDHPSICGALHHLKATTTATVQAPPGQVPKEQGWWARADSNGRPHPYQGCALTD